MKKPSGRLHFALMLILGALMTASINIATVADDEDGLLDLHPSESGVEEAVEGEAREARDRECGEPQEDGEEKELPLGPEGLGDDPPQDQPPIAEVESHLESVA